MIASVTNTLRAVAPTSINLVSLPGTIDNFPPITWNASPVRPSKVVQLEIPGSEISIPKQASAFHFSPDRKKICLESVPNKDWPKLALEIQYDTGGVSQITKFDLKPSSHSAIAGIKYTRFFLCLVESGNLSLDVGLGEPWVLHFDKKLLKESYYKIFRHRANYFRKCGFIEKALNCELDLPSELSGQDIFYVDALFNGLISGEYHTLAEGLNVQVIPNTVDLEQSPWRRPGFITYPAYDWSYLFGKAVDVGNVRIEAAHAQIGSFKALRQVEAGGSQPIEARFAVLDRQVTIHFERYANQTKKERERRLERYLYELSLEEPKSIYDLTLESLASDVTEKEADILSMGWTHINRLPDRYCPQTPVLDVSKKFWRVPLWITYPSGKGAAVADLFVDVKTGVVTSSLPVSEIRIRGKQLAQQLLYASETAVSSAKN